MGSLNSSEISKDRDLTIIKFAAQDRVLVHSGVKIIWTQERKIFYSEKVLRIQILSINEFQTKCCLLAALAVKELIGIIRAIFALLDG